MIMMETEGKGVIVVVGGVLRGVQEVVSKPPTTPGGTYESTCHVCIISTPPALFPSVPLLVPPERGLRQKGRTYGPL